LKLGLFDSSQIQQWVWVRIVDKETSEHWTAGTENHFVCRHLNLIITDQSHIRKLTVLIKIIEYLNSVTWE